MNNKFKHILISTVLLLVLGFSVSSFFNFNSSEPEPEAEIIVKPIEPVFEFGLCVDSFKVVKSKIKKNQFLADILFKTSYPISNNR